MREVEVAAVHEGDAEPLCRRLQHQLPRIEIVDRGGLQIGQPDRLAPRLERAGQIAVDEDRLLRDHRGIGDRAGTVGHVGGDEVDLVAVELARIERRVQLARQNDRRVETLAQPGGGVRAGVDVEVKLGMPPPQVAQMRKDALAREQRHDPEPQPHLPRAIVHRLDRGREHVERGGDLVEQALAIGVEFELLVLALEQLQPDEALERLHPAAERGCRERQLLRRRLDRAEAGDLHERLEGGEGR